MSGNLGIMQKRLNWQAFSNDNRNKIIEEVKEAISRSDGCIMNFTIFSDLALSLSVEIEENKIEALHRSLSSVLQVSDLDACAISAKSGKEMFVYINISFGSGKGELTSEIPAVPG